jgi:hypothetical protein
VTTNGGSTILSKTGNGSWEPWLPAPLSYIEGNGASLALPLVAQSGTAPSRFESG